jgi:hypothetical protein
VFVVSYAGKWNLETKEIRDPNNKDSLGNGMGGFNSTFMVSTADLQLNTSYTSPQPIDYWNAEIASVIGLSTKNMVGLGKGEYNSVLAMWQNQRLPVELGEYNPMTGLSMIKIQVPKSAWQAHRSYVRVWIGSYEGVSNEVLVPLASGRHSPDVNQRATFKPMPSNSTRFPGNSSAWRRLASRIEEWAVLRLAWITTVPAAVPSTRETMIDSAWSGDTASTWMPRNRIRATFGSSFGLSTAMPANP